MQFQLIKLVFVIFITTLWLDVFPQDTIYLSKGSIVNTKVISINLNTVKYKKSNYLNGPDFIIAKSEIDSIQFANGFSEIFVSSRNVITDSIIYSEHNASIVDTIIIDGIKFFIFKSSGYSHNRRHDFIVDFSNYVSSPVQLRAGDVSFIFEISNKDFTMYATVSNNLITIPFRFASSGSMRRFKKIVYNRINNIVFSTIHVKIDISETNARAFNKMFEAYYLEN